MATVDDLQELYRELDVADSSPPALQLAIVQSPTAGLLLRARLHRADLAHRVRVQHLRPHERPGQGHELVAEAAVAGDRSCLQQGLELPCLAPSLVVRGIAVEGAGERARPALGAKVGVRAEDDAVFGAGGHGGEDHPCDVLTTSVVALVDEQHVDVARVVQLLAAELAHADHGERNLGRDEIQCGLETRVRQRAELTTDGGKVGGAEQVACRDPQQLASTPPAERAIAACADAAPGVPVTLEATFVEEVIPVAQRREHLRFGDDGGRQRA